MFMNFKNLSFAITFLLFNTTSILTVGLLNPHNQSSSGLCQLVFLPKGSSVVSSSDNGQIFIWNTNTLEMQYELISEGGCADIVFTPDSQYLFTVQAGDMTGEGAVTVMWEAQTGQEVHRFEDRTNLSEDKKWILVTTARPEQVWDVATGELVHTFEQPIHAVPGAIFSPDNQKLISMNFPTQEAELWDINTNQLLFTFPSKKNGFNFSHLFLTR